jgi:putative AdoMet-dependent methyltransferase
MPEKDRFNSWAESYDDSLVNPKGYPFEGYRKVLGFMCKLTNISHKTEILDIGVGTGNLSYLLYEKGARIDGVDFSAKMLEKAKEKMLDGNFYIFDFSHGLPPKLLSRKYDYIVSSYAFHHLDDSAKLDFILMLKNLLKENGKIIIGDVSFLSRRSLYECRKASAELWDPDEYYIVAESFVSKLKSYGLAVEYTQISYCAGVIVIRCLNPV